MSSDFCAAASVLAGSPRLRKIASAAAPLMLAATMPDPDSAVSNDLGMISPALGELGPATTNIAFAPRWRAAIALYRRSAYARGLPLVLM